jgi:preprotein translocase subunit SecE
MGVRIPPPVQNKKEMTKVINYISASFSELKTDVTWPTWAEVQKLTIIVALFSITFSLLTWGVDEVFAKAIEGFFNWLKS